VGVAYIFLPLRPVTDFGEGSFWVKKKIAEGRKAGRESKKETNKQTNKQKTKKRPPPLLPSAQGLDLPLKTCQL